METRSLARLQVRIRRRTGPIPQRIPHVRSDPNHTLDRYSRKLSRKLLLPCLRNHQQSRGSLGQLPHERRSGFQRESKGDRTYPEVRFLQLNRLSRPSPETPHIVGIHNLSFCSAAIVEL